MWESLTDFFGYGDTASTAADASNWYDTAESLADAGTTVNSLQDFGNATGQTLGAYGDAPMSGLWDTASTTTPTTWGDTASKVGNWLTSPASANATTKVGQAAGVGGLANSNIANIAKTGAGLYNLYGNYKNAGQTGQYQDQLSNLISNPATMNSNPAYQYAQKTAQDAARRQAAASGMLGSGNLLAALQDRSSDVASQWYNQEANRLAALSKNSAAAKQAQQAQVMAGLGSLGKYFRLTS